VGVGAPVTIRQAAHAMQELSGKKMEVRYGPSKPEGDVGRIAVCDHARAILGWTPAVTFEEGLARMYHWMEKRFPPIVGIEATYSAQESGSDP